MLSEMKTTTLKQLKKKNKIEKNKRKYLNYLYFICSLVIYSFGCYPFFFSTTSVFCFGLLFINKAIR